MYEAKGQVVVPSANLDGPESVDPESKMIAVGLGKRLKRASACSVCSSLKPYPIMPIGVTIWQIGLAKAGGLSHMLPS